jgi:hypothetical protein
VLQDRFVPLLRKAKQNPNNPNGKNAEMAKCTPVWRVLDAECCEGFRVKGTGARVGWRPLLAAVIVIIVATAAAGGFGGGGNDVRDAGVVHLLIEGGQVFIGDFFDLG